MYKTQQSQYYGILHAIQQRVGENLLCSIHLDCEEFRYLVSSARQHEVFINATY